MSGSAVLRQLTFLVLAALCAVAVWVAALPHLDGIRRAREARALESDASRLVAEGRLAEALDTLQQATELDPEARPVGALRSLGMTAMASAEDLELARRAFSVLTRVTPRDPEAFFALGLAEARLGEYTSASLSFRRALERRPRWLEARINLGLSLAASGKSGSAAAVLGQVAEEMENPPVDVLYALGRVHLERTPPDIAAARDAFGRAATIEPRSPRPHLGLALAAYLDGEMGLAQAEVSEAEALDPNSPEVLATRGALLARAGKWDEAIEATNRALAVSPHHAISHYNLGCIYLRRREGLQAEAQFRAAVESQPGDPLMRLGWALALRLEGRSEESEAQLRKAIAQAAGDPTVQMALEELALASELRSGEQMTPPDEAL